MFGNGLQKSAVLGEQLKNALVAFGHDSGDFLIDVALGGIRILLGGPVVGIRAAQEAAAAFVQRNVGELAAHAQSGNHPPGDVRGLGDITAGAGGYGAVDNLFGGASAEKNIDSAQKFFPCLGESLLFGNRQHVAHHAVSPGYDGDFLHQMLIGCKNIHQGVPGFMVGRHFTLVGIEQFVLLLQSDGGFLHGFEEVFPGDFLPAEAHRQEGRFVHDVGQIGTGQSG